MHPRISSSHVNTHPRTRASHTPLHTRTHALMRLRAHAPVHLYTHAPMHKCIHANTHLCTRASAHSRCHLRASTYVLACDFGRLRARSCCCSLALPSVISGAWVLGRVPVHVPGCSQISVMVTRRLAARKDHVACPMLTCGGLWSQSRATLGSDDRAPAARSTGNSSQKH